MTESIFSPLWYKVSNLKISLDKQVVIQKQYSGKKKYYIICNTITNKHYRFHTNTYPFVGLLKGECTINEIWEHLNSAQNETDPTQGEIIQLLTRLAACDLIQVSGKNSFFEFHKRRKEEKEKTFKSKMLNPLSIRMHVANPDKFIEKTYPYIRWLFSLSMLFCALIFIVLGIMNIIIYQDDFYQDLQNNILDMSNLIILIPCYIIIKFFHELGHAYMIKKFHGRVTDFGFVFMAFIPFAYVDASASIMFKEKYKRLSVISIGMLIELFLASISFLIWINIDDSTLKVICLNITVIGIFSVFFFNGNPLLKYDGYYLLSELCNIPNLKTKYKEYLSYYFRKYIYGEHNIEVDSSYSILKKFFILIYGTLSFIYQFIIFFTILIYITNKYLFFGLLVSIWVMLTQLFTPLYSYFKNTIKQSQFTSNTKRVIGSWMLIFSTLYVVLFLIKMPYFIYAEGVVKIPDNLIVKAQTDGFVQAIHKSSGHQVSTTEPIASLDNPSLLYEKIYFTNKLKEAELEYSANLNNDYTKSMNFREESHKLKSKLLHINCKINKLSIKSKSDGNLILVQQNELMGKYLKKGDIIGYVNNGQPPIIQVIIPQSKIDIINDDITTIKIKYNLYAQTEYTGKLLSAKPILSKKLPSASLAKSGGGSIKTKDNGHALEAIQNIIALEVMLPEFKQEVLLGKKVYIKLYQTPKSIGHQIFLKLRKLLQSEIHV